MKPSPYRLELSTYPHHTVISPRFGDMDPLHHLNNVALAGIYEEGRVRFNSALSATRMLQRGDRLVIAEIVLRYLAEGQYPGDLTVGAGVLRVGGSSYVIGQGLFQGGLCIGVCDTVLVNTAAHRPTPLPDLFRSALSAHLIADNQTPKTPGSPEAPVPS